MRAWLACLAVAVAVVMFVFAGPRTAHAVVGCAIGCDETVCDFSSCFDCGICGGTACNDNTQCAPGSVCSGSICVTNTQCPSAGTQQSGFSYAGCRSSQPANSQFDSAYTCTSGQCYRCSTGYQWNTNTAACEAWSISLAASQTQASVGASVTLTATSSSSVDPYGYNIKIYRDTDLTNSLATCTTGNVCTASVTASSANTRTYLAKVKSSGTDIATSNSVSVTWGSSGACGNGNINAGEQCDGSNLNGQTCTTLGFYGGVLRCNADCTFDATQCGTLSCLYSDYKRDLTGGGLYTPPPTGGGDAGGDGITPILV